MTRKIGDKLTDKNGIKVIIYPEIFNCDKCIYSGKCTKDHPILEYNEDCGDGFIFVEDK